MFSFTRIGRIPNELSLVIQIGRFVEVWVDFTLFQVLFGQANTLIGPGGSFLTPQLFDGTESPSWFTQTDTTMVSPRCRAVVPWFHVRVKFACLWAARFTVLAAIT